MKSTGKKCQMAKEKLELSKFEEALSYTIKEWEEEKIEPLADIKLFKEYAGELEAVALDAIPCWNKFRNGGPFSFENGLMKTPMGTVLIHNGYYVMLDDLVARLPRIVDTP